MPSLTPTIVHTVAGGHATTIGDFMSTPPYSYIGPSYTYEDARSGNPEIWSISTTNMHVGQTWQYTNSYPGTIIYEEGAPRVIECFLAFDLTAYGSFSFAAFSVYDYFAVVDPHGEGWYSQFRVNAPFTGSTPADDLFIPGSFLTSGSVVYEVYNDGSYFPPGTDHGLAAALTPGAVNYFSLCSSDTLDDYMRTTIGHGDVGDSFVMNTNFSTIASLTLELAEGPPPETTAFIFDEWTIA